MKFKKAVLILTIVIICTVAGYFLFVQKYGFITRVYTNAEHEISSAELVQVKQLFEKNKLDIHGLQFAWFQTDDESQPQAIYEIHVAAKEFYTDLPIFFVGIIHRFNKQSGILESVSGQRITNLNISTIPRVSIYEAAKKSGVRSVFLKGELGVYSIDQKTSGDLNHDFKYVLAWKITPRNSEFPIAFVDATTGKVLSYLEDGIEY